MTDQSGDPRTEPTRWPQLAAAVAVAWAAVVLFPGRFVPMGPRGIDPAWQWAVNAAASQGTVFGRDLVFTYGPLAFLLAPLDVAANLAVATAFAVAVHIALIVTLLFWWKRSEHSGIVLAGVLVLLVAPALGLATEGLWLLTVAWLACTGVELAARWPMVVAAVLAGVFLLVKTSLAVAAVAAVGLAVIGERALLKRSVRWEVVGVWVLTVLVLGAVCFPSPAVAWAWWQRSLDVASGYSIANSIIGPVAYLVVGLVAVAAWIGVACVAWSDARLRRWALLTAPLVLIQFRLGYVRQDGHEQQLFGFLCALVALTVVMTRCRRQATAALVATGVAIVGFGVVAERSPASLGRSVVRAVAGVGGLSNLDAVLHWSETRRRLAAESAEQLRELQLPASWHARLGPAPGPVGTLPWECLIAPANGLEWDPTPTLQLYSAYTEDLDRWSATHYADDGPRWIVDEYVPVGKRHQMLDAPATWRALYRCYEPRDTATEPYSVLLERRRQPLPDRLVEVGRSVLVLETPLEVPQSSHMLFGFFDLELNGWGRLQSTLFRVPPVMLRLDHVSGRTTVYRMIPATAANGLLINRFPGRFFEHYLWLWSGRPVDEVVRITVTGPGTSELVETSTVVWRELRTGPVAE